MEDVLIMKRDEKNKKSAVLYAFSGLPGSGKTTLAKELSKIIGTTYIRIDTLEQGIKDLCRIDVQGEGYELSYSIIADNLIVGNSVVVDSCNPIKLTRNAYEKVAAGNNSRCINIEILCSDKTEHKKRIEIRNYDIKNLKLPTWEDVEKREYDKWDAERLIIDTAHKSIEESISELMYKISDEFK